MTLNDTSRGNRIHIGLFGRRNAGKSSLINALTGQKLAIVSQTPGTTADPVFKSMELHPVGPVVFVDTAGFDDEGELGFLRIAKTEETLAQTDLAVLVLDGPELAANCWGYKNAPAGVPIPAEDPLRLEGKWLRDLREAGAPVIIAVNKWDQLNEAGREIASAVAQRLSVSYGPGAEVGPAEMEQGAEPQPDIEVGPPCPVIPVSAKTGEGIDALRERIADAVPEDSRRNLMTAGLVEEEGLVLLVMPQDIQAPKGRLILLQVQTIRELLDRRCTVVSTTLDGLARSLQSLGRAPDLIITDSQCFGEVYEKKPEQSLLTSFSILMAASKGDIDVFVDGVSAIGDALDMSSSDAMGSSDSEAADQPLRILIAEACTHVPQNEDIGTVKIPRLLKKRFGERVEITNVRGKDFPDAEGLRNYDLIIHCGACMFNRSLVMHRIRMAQQAGVPITNYGIFLAKMSGILDKVSLPEGSCR